MFTTVALAIFGKTRFSSHAYVGCVATLKELLSQATPPTSLLQYGFMLMIIGILQFTSKFYLIFDVFDVLTVLLTVRTTVMSTIITSVLAQRYAIAQSVSLHYSRPIATTVLSVMYFHGTTKLHLSPHG